MVFVPLGENVRIIEKSTKPGPRFTNGFSIAFQIRWRFTVISSLIEWSLQNFVHGTTAVLSWHVQKIVAIWRPATELQQDEVSIEFELQAKKTLVKRAPGTFKLSQCRHRSISPCGNTRPHSATVSKSYGQLDRHALNSLRLRRNTCHFAKSISNAFSWMKM